MFCLNLFIIFLFLFSVHYTGYGFAGASLDVQYEIETGHKVPSSLAPLIRSDSLAQL